MDKKKVVLIVLLISMPILLGILALLLLPDWSLKTLSPSLPPRLLSNDAPNEHFEPLIAEGGSGFIEGVHPLADAPKFKNDGDYRELEIVSYNGRTGIAVPISDGPFEIRAELAPGSLSSGKKEIYAQVLLGATPEELNDKLMHMNEQNKRGVHVDLGEKSEPDGLARFRHVCSIPGKESQGTLQINYENSLEYRARHRSHSTSSGSGDRIPNDGYVGVVFENVNTPLRIANLRIYRLPPVEWEDVSPSWQKYRLTPEEVAEGWLSLTYPGSIQNIGSRATAKRLQTTTNYKLQFEYQGSAPEKSPAGTLQFQCSSNITHVCGLEKTPKFRQVVVDKSDERLLITIDGTKVQEIVFAHEPGAAWSGTSQELTICGGGFINYRNVRLLPRDLMPLTTGLEDADGVTTLTPEKPLSLNVLPPEKPLLVVWEARFGDKKTQLQTAGERLSACEFYLDDSKNDQWIPLAITWVGENNKHFPKQAFVECFANGQISYSRFLQNSNRFSKEFRLEAKQGNVMIRNVRMSK